VSDISVQPDGTGALRTDHRLFVSSVELIGGGREVTMSQGLNLVRGDITTGKTTFVRLLRALLARVSGALPPEVASVRAVQGTVQLRQFEWRIYRPLVTTSDAPVEVARVDEDNPEPEAIRLAATGAEASYSSFLLSQLGLPIVVVPEGSSGATARLNPVSMTDWLGYCIVTGDELDSEVFGHRETFRDRKRRAVFELIYGLYDSELSDLLAQRRSVELKLDALEHDGDIIAKFLAGTPFADGLVLAAELDAREQQLIQVRAARNALVTRSASGAGEIGSLRGRVLELRLTRDRLHEDSTLLSAQLDDLSELLRQLNSQSAKLTRAIVAGEWLVDFDFVVCPRCGNDVSPTSEDDGNCYLCHQPERPGNSQEVLLAEQRRVVSQIGETESVSQLRAESLAETQRSLDEVDAQLGAEARQLDSVTASFVSDEATVISLQAAEEARLETEIAKLVEYGHLLSRRDDRDSEKAQLQQQLFALSESIDAKSVDVGTAEDNIRALESRLFEYLERLHIPQLADTLTVRINRTTFMPEVSGRSFDELSSQGLKTLVNAAHALAHHTVAIDRGLPLPGFLVLDGVSANSGHDGFDQDRIEDLYRLILEIGIDYLDTLQLVVVDNDVPGQLADELAQYDVLVLSQADRLIRTGLVTNTEEHDQI
jgi:hypothetical protein